MEQKEIQDYIKQLNLKDGDVLFVDAETVDIMALAKNFPAHSGCVSVIAVNVPPGKSVADCVDKGDSNTKVICSTS
jgi:hypothetical protein